jgi:hypothetical protein
MTVDQYSAFIAIMPQIEGLLKGLGESVPRPNFDDTVQTATSAKGEEEDLPTKSNIEATSDEEE